MSVRRHRWKVTDRFAHATLRECKDCGLIKITRHEPTAHPPHWIEFYRGATRCPAMPPCRAPIAASVSAQEVSP